MICWKCKKEINVEKVFRNSECPFCSVDLHCCKNCRFYSTGSHFDCREDISEVIADKEKANFCEFFCAKADDAGNKAEEEKSVKAKNAINALFGENITEKVLDSKENAKSSFNALFGD